MLKPLPSFYGSFYFTRNFQLPKFENRGCRTGNFLYDSPTVGIALREPKNGYATTIFKLLVTGISSEIDISYFYPPVTRKRWRRCLDRMNPDRLALSLIRIFQFSFCYFYPIFLLPDTYLASGLFEVSGKNLVQV